MLWVRANLRPLFPTDMGRPQEQKWVLLYDGWLDWCWIIQVQSKSNPSPVQAWYSSSLSSGQMHGMDMCSLCSKKNNQDKTKLTSFSLLGYQAALQKHCLNPFLKQFYAQYYDVLKLWPRHSSRGWRLQWVISLSYSSLQLPTLLQLKQD